MSTQLIIFPRIKPESANWIWAALRNEYGEQYRAIYQDYWQADPPSSSKQVVGQGEYSTIQH